MKRTQIQRSSLPFAVLAVRPRSVKLNPSNVTVKTEKDQCAWLNNTHQGLLDKVLQFENVPCVSHCLGKRHGIAVD